MRLRRWAGRSVLVGLIVHSAAALAGGAAMADPVAVPDTLSQRLQPCTLCHGAEGRAGREGYLPRIAGKPAGYLYQQLLSFRDGHRANAAMADLLAHQNDAYLWEMATHFAALDLPYAPPPPSAATPAQLARGLALVRDGDPALQLPACSACHGSSLGGRLPAVPGLLGLPRDYLIGQLGAWRTGGRRAVAPDCMAQISRRMRPEDIGAVATWLAAQPVPAGHHPEAASAAPAPLACGALIRPAR